MRNALLILTFITVAACDAPTGGPAIPDIGDDTCAAGQYSDLIGQDATALERVLRLGQVRIIRPGTMVTADFRPSRINYEIGSSNRIIRIYCG